MITPQKICLNLLAALFVLSACTDTSNKEVNLEGSWDLTQFIHPNDPKDNWVSHGDSIVYQKHLSSDHFVWFKYDKKNNVLIGMGGGTYIMKDGKYIENINFFYPPGSSELGQSIPFDYQIKDKTWYHKGFAKQFEQNWESGEIVVVDSNKIEERWVKTSTESNANTALAGTWDLISFRDSANTEYTEYPDFIGYMKLLTPTHFTWIYYDIHGDEIYAAGSGEYKYDGTNYVETLGMIHQDKLSIIGGTQSFKANLNNINWSHKGYIPFISIDTNTGRIIKDSSLIDQRWVVHSEEVYNNIIY